MKETTKGLLKTESDSDYERSINGSPTKMMPVTGKFNCKYQQVSSRNVLLLF